MGDFIGYAKLRPGRIHLFCPKCKRKQSNSRRDPRDPANAVLAHVYCEGCSMGCKIEGVSAFLTAQGRFLSYEEIERAYESADRGEEGANG